MVINVPTHYRVYLRLSKCYLSKTELHFTKPPAAGKLQKCSTQSKTAIMSIIYNEKSAITSII
jgi:hypothetical protein